MSDIKVFENKEFGNLRTVILEDNIWFVGKDVAAALGYGEGKSLANAVANHVDDEDKGVTKMMTPGGIQNVTIINESGLYSLILSSKLPSAKRFKHWVTSEVLPSIRKNGQYIVNAKSDISPMLQMCQILLDKAIETEKIQKEHSEKIAALEESVQEIKNTTPVGADMWVSHMKQKVSDYSLSKGKQKDGWCYRSLYRDMEVKCGCNLDAMLAKKRKKEMQYGMSATAAETIKKLDVIAESPNLRADFESILGKYC